MTFMQPDGTKTQADELRVTIVPTEEVKVQIESFRGPQGTPGAAGELGTNGLNGKDGTDGVSPVVSFEQIDVGYRLTITDKDGTHSIELVNGSQGLPGPAGPQGPQGERGAPFAIAKIYSSIAQMNAGYAGDGVPVGGFVLIETCNVEDEENARLYVKGESRYEYLTDLSGAQGIQGPQGPVGPQGNTGDIGPQGPKGDTGSAGKTPVKGTDYWTAEDQASMVAQVIAALPDASEVSY